MQLNTLKDIPELQGKKILLRVDFNVPIDKGKIQDDSRIIGSLETIKYLLDKEAKIIIMSHLGRPEGKVEESLRLDLVAKHLEKLLGQKVTKLDRVIGEETTKTIDKMKNGEIVMLENVRFESGEEECSESFTKELAALGDIFVNDAFGTAHRKHASTAGLADYLPAYAGFLIQREIEALSPILQGKFEKPLTMIFGGAKIDTKIGVIKNFIKKADYFLMGGGLANTFLYAAGYNVGASLYEEDKSELAREIMLECEKEKEKFVLPKDVVIADEISENAKTLNLPVQDILDDMKILDIGKLSAEHYCEIINKSKTIIWNGPLGLCEMKPFRNGSKTVAECLAKHDCISIIGGGDTADCIKKLNVPVEAFTHLSTGGGAAIEYLEGKELPGIAVLKK